MKSQKGFTLIELLVVIAIIGILSGIVLVSLSSARVKAKRVAVQSDLKSALNETFLVSDDGKTFDDICQTEFLLTGSGKLKDILQQMVDHGAMGVWCTVSNEGTDIAYALTLDPDPNNPANTNNPNNSANHWCVDSSGYVGKGYWHGCGKCVNDADVISTCPNYHRSPR